MPGIMDLATKKANTHQGQAAAIALELETAKQFGAEINEMDLTLKQAAQVDLVPVLEQANTLAELKDFNEKARKWIDNKQLNP